MSDDLVRKLREARYVAFDECGDYDLAQEAATALTEARAEIERLLGDLANERRVVTNQSEARVSAESKLSTLRDILVLCGELGGMGKDETPADYLRRLIEEVAGSETEREFARARVSELASENTNLRNDLVQRGMAEESLRARAEKAESALAEAVEALRPVASREMQNINDEVDNYGTRYQSQWFADAMASARAFIAEHGSDSKGE